MYEKGLLGWGWTTQFERVGIQWKITHHLRDIVKTPIFCTLKSRWQCIHILWWQLTFVIFARKCSYHCSQLVLSLFYLIVIIFSLLWMHCCFIKYSDLEEIEFKHSSLMKGIVTQAIGKLSSSPFSPEGLEALEPLSPTFRNGLNYNNTLHSRCSWTQHSRISANAAVFKPVN